MQIFLPPALLSLILCSLVACAPGLNKRDGDSELANTQVVESLAEVPDSISHTTFNGLDVPAMTELSGEKFKEQIKDGYWFVKYFSPNCPHCIAIAPTSNPVSTPSNQKDSLNNFHHFYNFHFASLDCIAFGDTCDAHKVNAFPTFSLYKNGELLKTFAGTKNLNNLSIFVEEALESIRPGSRPKEGVKLPEVGASSTKAEATLETPVVKDGAGATPSTEQNGNKEELPSQTLSQSTTISATKTALSSKIASTLAPPKYVVTPNPLGSSVSLSAESFQDKVTTTQDPWFIKFYAPWCHHCQVLAPNWAQLGKEMKNKLNIGEVNCDIESRLCKDVKLKGYPTILFFRGGERVEYTGLRGFGDLLHFASKALEIGDGIPDVDADTFKAMEENEEVIFVYFYDHATTSEDFIALDRLTLSLIGHAKLVKTKSLALAEKFRISTWPRLLVSRDGRASYYTALAPKVMRDYRRVFNWMKSVWLPIVPELTASNSREIMDGRLIVLGILTRDRPEDFIVSKREIKNAALEWMDKETKAFQLERQERRQSKQLRIEEAEDRNDQRALRAAKSIRINMDKSDRREVGFAWVDGVFWERWVKTTYGIDVRNGERVVINDEDNHRYWDITDAGGFIVPSRTSILETLPKVVTSPPKLKPKSTSGSFGTIYFAARAASSQHPYFSMGLIVVLVIAIVLWGRGRIRRARGPNNGPGTGGGFFRLDGKDGLLSGNGSNGKFD
ncbi:MAG: hypothetical protein M1829_006942 [Trizodia sp. TS-e1964]|nr:MAG: hypothetical protein M1829_006942 [Trizodia sp. TS-e1964]